MKRVSVCIVLALLAAGAGLCPPVEAREKTNTSSSRDLAFQGNKGVFSGAPKQEKKSERKSLKRVRTGEKKSRTSGWKKSNKDGKKHKGFFSRWRNR